jgi:hypothetical protein
MADETTGGTTTSTGPSKIIRQDHLLEKTDQTTRSGLDRKKDRLGLVWEGKWADMRLLEEDLKTIRGKQ